MNSISRFGTVDKEADGYRVSFKRVLRHDIDTVWDAITQPKHLARWFTDVELEFVKGGDMAIYFRDEAKTKTFGKILRIEPKTLFEYSWEGELATWKLKVLDVGSCQLELIYSKLPASYATSVPAGWHIILDQLEEVLGGAPGYYPFGGEETETARKMKKYYEKEMLKQFPELTQVS